MTLTPVPTPPGHSTSVKSPTCTFITTLLHYFPDPRSAPEATSSTGMSISVESVSLIRVFFFDDISVVTAISRTPEASLTSLRRRATKYTSATSGSKAAGFLSGYQNQTNDYPEFIERKASILGTLELSHPLEVSPFFSTYVFQATTLSIPAFCLRSLHQFLPPSTLLMS